MIEGYKPRPPIDVRSIAEGIDAVDAIGYPVKISTVIPLGIPAETIAYNPQQLRGILDTVFINHGDRTVTLSEYYE